MLKLFRNQVAQAALSEAAAVSLAQQLKHAHDGERSQLDVVRRYWKGIQSLPAVIPSSAPREVRTMARIARVNVCSIVVDSLAQATFVDNFRTQNDGEDAAVWQVWQANKLDARQTAIHRAAFAYRAAYATVVPGATSDDLPIVRGVSPRHLIAMYGDDPDWPVHALENRLGGRWRLYDDTAYYDLTLHVDDRNDDQAALDQARGGQGRQPEFEFVRAVPHGAGVTPVVRYLDEEDLDADDDVQADPMFVMHGFGEPHLGQIAPLMPIQDQIDLTTYGLLVAQWYSAFRQRYAIGWTTDDETEKMKAAASQLWTFDEDPSELQLGEFSQTDLSGYIKSRESSMKHAATLSQTPVHELIGDLVNLSAEALAAAEQGHERKVAERKSTLGESHEQMLKLAGEMANIDVPDDAQVVWRDTSARSFSATIDALGKIAQMLGVPRTELWQRIPGVTKQDVERWKAEYATGDAFRELAELLSAETGAGAQVTITD